MRYVVGCRVSGGVTGTRQSVLKHGGKVEYFESREAAELRASHLRRQMNHQYSVATFEYWAEEEGYVQQLQEARL